MFTQQYGTDSPCTCHMLFIKVIFIYYEAPTVGRSARSWDSLLADWFQLGEGAPGISSLMPTQPTSTLTSLNTRKQSELLPGRSGKSFSGKGVPLTECSLGRVQPQRVSGPV